MAIFIGFIIGIIAYVIEYLGKGIQKFSIEGWKTDKSVKSKHTGYFIIGTILTSTYVFIQWVALIFAPVNLIAPLESLGLIVLIIFSYFILKEEISKKQIVGIILILIGTIFMTLFNLNTGDIQYADFNQFSFLIFTIILVLAEVVAILVSKFNSYKAAGLIIGTSAGTFMALQTVTKRITAIPDPMLALIFTFLSFGVTIMTFLLTQFAFAKANANIVVPCFTSASIIIAILIGVIALSEEIILIQILGIIIIFIGVILLTGFRKNETFEEKGK
ncbi:MAG: EamA family transporter [Candidatus Hermodarchaeota archaeon]